MPSVSFTGALCTRSRGQVSYSDMSAAGSRSMMNAVLEFGRTFSWAIWPSTQTVPSRSIQPATLMATARTGHGLSAEDWPGSEDGHLAVARVILLASRVWNGARDLVASS